MSSRVRYVPDQRTASQAVNDLIWALAIPTTPTRVDRGEAARGLALLDLALRMNHVVRLEERLRFEDRAFMHRHIAMDLDLSSLGSDQIRALSEHWEQRSPSADGRIWVPISRQVDGDISSAAVLDSTSSVLPRMTARESKGYLATGLVQMFRILSESHPDSALKGTPLYAILHSSNRARWLIEHAIVRLVTGSFPLGTNLILSSSAQASRRLPVSVSTRRADPEQPVESDPLDIRTQAASALQALIETSNASYLHPFLTLLEVAGRSDLLVVSVPTRGESHHLTYQAPKLRAEHTRNGIARWLRKWAPYTGTLRGEVSTTIPHGLRSYHASLEVDDDVYVSRMTMTTDADAGMRERVASACRALAEITTDGRGSRLDALRSAPSRPSASTNTKLLEHELQALSFDLAEIASRKSESAARHGEYLHRSFARFGLRYKTPIQPSLSENEALASLAGGDFGLRELASFSGHYRAGAYSQLAKDATVTPDLLLKLATRLETLEVEKDIVSDKDPADNWGQISWRGGDSSMQRESSEPVKATIAFTLRDEAPSLIEETRRFLISNLALVLGIGLILFGASLGGDPLTTWVCRGYEACALGIGSQPIAQDALAAVLLLVPGLLITRLAIPARDSIRRDIRAFQVRSAYVAVTSTTALAALCAATASRPFLVVGFRVVAVGLLISIILNALETLARMRRRAETVASRASLPRWLLEHMMAHRGPGEGRPRKSGPKPDAYFDAAGAWRV